MNGQDWLDSIAVSSLFLPYWKAAGKYLWQVSIGLVAFVVSKTLKGEAAMNKPDVNDYMIAYPLAVPFWVVGFVYLFFNLAADGLVNPLLVMFLFFFWLHSFQHSLTRILEHHSRKTAPNAETEVLSCPQLAKT